MPSAVDVADLLLAAVARGRAGAVLVEPAGEQHAISIEGPGGGRRLTAIPADLGDAVVARLSLVAGLDLLASEQLGRMRLRAGKVECQVLVSVTAGSDGLAAELRRITPPPANIHAGPALHVSDAAHDRIGPYRLLGELGRGGTGVVYRAQHELLGRPVAIKVLYVDVAADPVAASRFVREARAASRARHPGIVDVLDFGALPDGRSYLVMELVQGQTLDQLLAGGAIDPLRAVLLIHQVALALEAAHRGGVVHRDLKPANVFVVAEPDGADPQVKIGDFGAAKLDPKVVPSPAVTQGNLVFGTPFYMSPEHASGRPTDRRADIYSLGCVLFELVSGHVPFTGETTFDIMTRQVNDAPPPLSSPHGPIPTALDRVVTRALAKPPEHRYQTAREMATDLEMAAAALKRAGWRKWLPL